MPQLLFRRQMYGKRRSSMPTNLLQSAAAIAASDYTLFSGSSSVTLTNDTTVFHSGGSSLKAVLSSNDYPYIYISNAQTCGAIVTAGSTYTSSMWVNPSLTTTFTAHLSWYTSSNSYISGTSGGTGTSCPSGVWTELSYTTTAVSTAAYASPQIETFVQVSTPFTYNIDDWGIAAGSSPAT